MTEYEQALRELYALALRGIEPGLDRMHAALAALGHPERDLAIVHVAGTNGKGSVAAMVAQGLSKGQRVGLYTSPHLCRLMERMRICGGPPIERGDVVEAWNAVRDLEVALTFFEALTAMALVLFRSRVDVAVLEVGLGGRLDATNVVEHPLTCAITRVAIDHQRLLGSDLASIAGEKAGILKSGAPAVVAPQRVEAMDVIVREAQRVGSPLSIVGRDVFVSAENGLLRVYDTERSLADLRPCLAGAHQHENIAVAAGVLWKLEELGLAVDVRDAVESVIWPGRLERLEAGRTSFLLDAAHNPDGARTLAEFLVHEKRRRRVLLFGAMADKDWRAMLALLRPHIDELVCTAPPLPRAEDPAILAAEGGHATASIEEAIQLAQQLAGKDGEVVVAGSIYSMGAVRGRLLGLECDPPIAL